MITFAAHQARAGPAGAAEDFEQMLGLLVRATSGEANLVFANPGDWGIDVLVGDLRGRVTVWQAKYFARGVGRSQQSQILASFESALKAAREHGYKLERWVLCIPASMDGPTLQWWQGWKAGRERDSGVSIDLWDETGLRDLLLRPEAGNVRRHYYNPYRADTSQAVKFPYRGLSAFGEQDAALFFGRDAAAAEVLELMSARLDGDGLAVVSGVSGAGKSSLLRAGVLPQLRKSGLAGAAEAASWPCRVFAPGRRPLDELAVQIAPLARADAAEVRGRLAADPDGFALTARQAALEATDPAAATVNAGQRRVVLVVDQCEQLYTSCDVAAERDAFITALHAAAAGNDPAALVVLVVRADFEARLADYQQLIAAVKDRYLLTAMTGRQLQLAITRPAAGAGSWVEDDLVQVLLDEVRARSGRPGPPGETPAAAPAGVLPLLSHALDQAWRTRSGHTLTLADYERTGGIEGAVAVSAQRVYERLSQAQREAARQVFTRLVATSGDGNDTAVRVARSDLSAGKDDAGKRDVETVLEEFAAARLLILDADAVEISHEALLSAWPLLRDDWLAGARADRIVRTRLHATAQEWIQDSRDPSYLYTGSLLDAAAGTAARIDADPRHTPLSEAEKAFLRASRHAERRRVRLRQRFTAVLLALLVGLAAVTVTAVKASQSAASQRDLAVSDQLISASQAFRSTNATIARQDSLAAWAIEPSSSQAWSGMVAAAADPQIATITDGAGPLGEVRFSPDGKVLAVREGNGAAALWNVAALTRLGTVPHADAMTFSPDSKLLAATDTNGTVRLWNVATRTQAGTLVTAIRGVEAGAVPAVFSPDGRTAAVSLGGAVELWNVPARHKIWTAGNPRADDPYAPVAFLPGGKMLLSYDQVPWLLDAATRKLTRIPTTFPYGAAEVPLSPHGTTLLGADKDGNLRLWEAATGRDLGALPDSVGTFTLNAFAFSPDGRELATADDSDGAVRLWDVATRKQIGATINTNANGVSGLAFSPDGQTLATSDGDGTVRLWDVATNPQIIQSHDATAAIAAAEMTRDGKTLTTADAYGAIHVWDAATGEQISAIPAVDTGFPSATAEGQQGIGEAALSPDGKALALAHNRTVELWDIAAGGKAATLTGSRVFAHWLDSLAFSPDSTTLAVGDNYGHITLWNAATDRQTGTLTVPPCDIRSLAFSTDGKILADSENSGRVRLWDVATRHLTGSYSGGSDLYSSVALSPDGKTIAAVNGNDTVVLWDVATHKQTSVPLRADSSDTGLLTFSPDSKLLAVLADNGTVRVWGMAASQQTGADLSGGGGISALAFSPDGRTLITGDGDGASQLWNTSYLDSPLKVLCSQVGGTLTLAEWQRDVPPGPAYRNVCP